jgi:hypothetical protein
MSIQIGVIAEDVSDVEVAKLLLTKRAKKKFQVKHHIGHGCGTILSKCQGWTKSLSDRGCTVLILLHDLDERKLGFLRTALTNAMALAKIDKFLIAIPIKELEAWLLADEAAITSALKLKKKFPRVTEPERERDPKKKLGDLIYATSNKSVTYINTIHNRKIASELSLEILRLKCPSFVPFDDFANEHLGTKKTLAIISKDKASKG